MRPLFFVAIVVFSFPSYAKVWKSFKMGKQNALSVVNAKGDLAVTTYEGKEVQVMTRSSVKGCKIQQQQRGKELVIKINDESGKCLSDIEVMVPESLRLRVENQKGDVDVSGEFSSVQFEVGEGDVEIFSGTKNFQGQIGKGNLEVFDFSGSGSLMVQEGVAKVHFMELPKEGYLNLQGDKVRALVEVPRGSNLSDQLQALNTKTNKFVDVKSTTGFRMNLVSEKGEVFVGER